MVNLEMVQASLVGGMLCDSFCGFRTTCTISESFTFLQSIFPFMQFDMVRISNCVQWLVSQRFLYYIVHSFYIHFWNASCVPNGHVVETLSTNGQRKYIS